MEKVRKLTGIVLAFVIAVAGVLITPMDRAVVQASEYSIPSSAKEYGGHYYKLYSSKSGISWSRAEEKCEALGGHLVVITSVQEEAFVEKLQIQKGKKSG
jgi:hypothetical protein